MSYPEWINPTEAKIIDCLIDTILAAGHKIDVRDAYGDSDEPVEPMTDKALIQAEVAATGETLFEIDSIGWVMLVHGNGVDVISDYTTNVEGLMAPAEKLAEGLDQ